MSCLIIGNFDGVHRGHQALIRRALEIAHELQGRAIALTFDPHPTHVLRPDNAPALLTTTEEKQALLFACGLDEVHVQTFDTLFSQLSPRDFIEQIVVPLKVQTILIGVDFHFGKDRTGTIEMLQELGQEFGYYVETFQPIYEGDQPISSTRVREALAVGNTRAAALLLGRPL